MYHVSPMRNMQSFNRTIVELKHRIVVGIVTQNPAFNRTIVELKLNNGWLAE